MIVIFFLGIGMMLASPFFRRRNAGNPMLAAGALLVLVFSAVGLLNVDPRIGTAAIQSNRKEYLFCLASQLPVLILALLSWRHYKWAFWAGWGINVAFSLLVLWVIVELEFFWHW